MHIFGDHHTKLHIFAGNGRNPKIFQKLASPSCLLPLVRSQVRSYVSKKLPTTEPGSGARRSFKGDRLNDASSIHKPNLNAAETDGTQCLPTRGSTLSLFGNLDRGTQGEAEQICTDYVLKDRRITSVSLSILYHDCFSVQGATTSKASKFGSCSLNIWHPGCICAMHRVCSSAAGSFCSLHFLQRFPAQRTASLHSKLGNP